MASWVEIANMIGTHVGSSTRITDPDDDRTLARKIRAVWDLQRREAIRDGSWNFAVQRDKPAALVDVPAHGFEYQFNLPSSCLRLIEVRAGGGQIDDYRLEAGRILCNHSGPIETICLVDVEEPAKWDAAFTAAFAWRVAWAIGNSVSGSAFDKQGAWRGYTEASAAAKRVDAMENPPIEREESDWITARHSGAFWHPRA